MGERPILVSGRIGRRVVGLCSVLVLAVGCGENLDSGGEPSRPSQAIVSIGGEVAARAVRSAPAGHPIGGSAPRGASGSAPGRPSGLDPAHDLRTAIRTIRAAYVACATAPEHCDRAAIVAAGSRAARWLDHHVEDLLRWNLGRPPDVPGDTFEIETVHHQSGESAAVRLCIVNDLPLVDRVDPEDPDDDIPYPNPLLSVATEWELVVTDAGWRLAHAEPVGYFPGMSMCRYER